jgi:hypothetical protein
MTADTLAPDGAAVTLGPPAPDERGDPSAFLGYVAMPAGNDGIITLTQSTTNSGFNAQELTATGYDIGGHVLFRTVLFDNVNDIPLGVGGARLAELANGDVAVAWNEVDGLTLAGQSTNAYALISPTGVKLAEAFLPNDSGTDQYGSYIVPIMHPPTALYATAAGFNLEWEEQSRPFDSPHIRYGYAVDYFDLSGNNNRVVWPENSLGQITPTAHAFAAGWDGAANSLQVADNAVQYWDGTTLHEAVAIPGEPASAITDEAAAMLAGGQAAVAWVDSGTDYVSLFDPATESFGARIGLDWGGASDIHVVGLPDGGFAVSWQNDGAYKGEVFDAAGAGGGNISLAGDVAGVDSHGDLYTVALDASGGYDVQTYAINGGSSGGGTTGQTFNSDDNGDVWVGTAGNDTCTLGRGGDWVTGNGGDDTYRFAGIPWAGGHITDFNAGDVLDLTGLMSTTSATGTDGFADGYLKITDDGSGNAQVWADYHITGNDGWWLVETLDGVAPASLQHVDDVISIGSSTGPTAVSTAAPHYTAPANVTSITLTGAQQYVDASATSGVTITSNDSGNVLIGGAGDDTFHLGRGGDWVAGGAGADTFAYSGTPWAGGGVTDFNAAQGDRIDVSGLLAASGFTGADPFADGYLQLTSDSSGNAQLWSDVRQSGNDGWWLVATLDGVSTSSLHYSGGMIT